MVFSMDELLSATGLTSPLVGGTIGLIVLLNLTFRYYSSSSLFQRDGVGNSFGGSITGSVSLLSNPDSMIQRENVKDEMENYDNMFLGARTNVGSLHKQESIEKRQKEYQTMVNSFYNLVTDFYEYGWGQVNDIYLFYCFIVLLFLSSKLPSCHLFCCSVVLFCLFLFCHSNHYICWSRSLLGGNDDDQCVFLFCFWSLAVLFDGTTFPWIYLE